MRSLKLWIPVGLTLLALWVMPIATVFAQEEGSAEATASVGVGFMIALLALILLLVGVVAVIGAVGLGVIGIGYWQVSGD